MELTVIRKEFYDDRVVGELYTNDKFFSYTLEDTDRDLTNQDSVTKLKSTKIAKRTAIPYGRYRVILSYSIKLKRYLPLILDVPQWRGIRLHAGADPTYSSGCVLLGLERKGNSLYKIKAAEQALVKLLNSINMTEAIYITIKKDDNK
jgi:hypothetical protein